MALHFGKAISVFRQTLPFVWLRIGVGVAFGLVALLYFAMVGLVLYFLGGSISSLILVIIVLASIALFGWVYTLARKYILYLVSAGHVAVIAHTVHQGEPPENQVSYGKDMVKANFVSASALFALDQVIKTVLNQFNRAVIRLTNLIDFVPALKNIVTILRRSVTLVGRQLDHAIMAQIFIEEEKSNWAAARDGLVLYAKCWKSLLASSLILVLGMYAVAGLLLLLVSPVALVIGQFGNVGQFIGWAFVIGIVLTIHFGFVDPFVKTVLITTYLEESKELTPDSETMDFLEERSSKFREVLDNAEKEEAEQPTPAADEPGETPAPQG